MTIGKDGAAMKWIMKWLLPVIFLMGCIVPCQAANQQDMNQKLGYFENTRTVLLLPAVYSYDGDEAALYVNQSMNRIFRYPYYRTLDAAAYEGKAYSPSELSTLAEKTGADLVIMPVVTQWVQRVYHRSMFIDADDIVETKAVIDIYSYKTSDGTLRDDRSSYWNSEEEGMVRNRYILDDMMKQIYKTFPYWRVPTDVAKNLSGAPDMTPISAMKQ